MTVFSDASAVVKRYADERGSELVRGLGAAYVSELTRVEAPSALWRKHRAGTLESAEVADLVAWFEHEFTAASGDFVPVALDRDQLDEAADLVKRHGLRSGDAIQLAAGLAVRRADPSCRQFACFDRSLASAAAAEGFDIVA